MCLTIEMRYMPTGNVLQVFLRCSRYAIFKHEKPGGLVYVNIGKPVSYDGHVHV